MKSQSRNLLLFFEENEYTDNISSKLVRLYMNRFVIEEEKRYEIIGTFNLSKVYKSSKSPDGQRNSIFNKDYIIDHAWQKNSKEMFEINWYKDKQIIVKALNETNIFTKHHLETHIIIGTSLYIDHFDASLNKLIPSWNSRIQKIYGLRNTESIYNVLDGESSLDLSRIKNPKLSSSHNQLTLLNGWKSTFATTDQVRQAYRESMKKNRDPEKNKISVNDDLENMSERNYKPHKFFKRTSGHERVKTFLYEMLSDDEMENQQSNEIKFLQSKCERLTVALY